MLGTGKAAARWFLGLPRISGGWMDDGNRWATLLFWMSDHDKHCLLQCWVKYYSHATKVGSVFAISITCPQTGSNLVTSLNLKGKPSNWVPNAATWLRNSMTARRHVYATTWLSKTTRSPSAWIGLLLVPCTPTRAARSSSAFQHKTPWLKKKDAQREKKVKLWLKCSGFIIVLLLITPKSIITRSWGAATQVCILCIRACQYVCTCSKPLYRERESVYIIHTCMWICVHMFKADLPQMRKRVVMHTCMLVCMYMFKAAYRELEGRSWGGATLLADRRVVWWESLDIGSSSVHWSLRGWLAPSACIYIYVNV